MPKYMCSWQKKYFCVVNHLFVLGPQVEMTIVQNLK